MRLGKAFAKPLARMALSSWALAAVPLSGLLLVMVAALADLRWLAAATFIAGWFLGALHMWQSMISDGWTHPSDWEG